MNRDEAQKTLKHTFGEDFYGTLKALVKDVLHVRVPENIKNAPNLLLKFTRDESTCYGSRVVAETGVGGTFLYFRVLCGEADWIYYSSRFHGLVIDLNVWANTNSHIEKTDDMVTITVTNRVW